MSDDDENQNDYSDDQNIDIAFNENVRFLLCYSFELVR
jgi:hypothetical protein